MKKNSVYVALALLVGLVLGYFIFGNKYVDSTIQSDESLANSSLMVWTCAMHPQIRQTEEGDCPICGMDLISNEGDTDGLGTDQFRMTENAIALANIETSIVGNHTLESQGLKLSGSIKTNEEGIAVQVTHFTGRVEKLMVKSVGEKISKGQILAMIYSPELVAAQQELLTAVSLKKSQPELYNAVRNKLRIKKISKIQIDQIESSGKIKEVFPVYAYINGVVSAKMVAEGDHIKTGQVLYEIANLNTVWASFDAYENQISLLKKGQNISIKTNAYPTKSFDAKISFIDPMLTQSTRTITVRAVLKNDEAIFKPGMFVEGFVSAVGTISESSISVPKSAVLWTGKRSIVYVKIQSDQSVFQMREVLLGTVIGDNYLIVSGIVNGEEIVTNGTFTVDAAAQLSGKKSMMNTKISTNKIDKRMHIELPESFQQQFVSILPNYFMMKDALVKDDLKNTSLFSEKMNKEFKAIVISNLGKDEQLLVKNSIELLGLISREKSLENQRAYFVDLNKNVITIGKNIQKLQSTIYIQECPMANNNKGAVWLSQEKEIKNPYFGSQMITCGSVIQVLEVE